MAGNGRMKMTANELINKIEKIQNNKENIDWYVLQFVVPMLRQQQAEIEDLKNANRFIQNFAEEQHKRAVALEMREVTDEEIIKVYEDMLGVASAKGSAIDFARAILKKASEK